jgi:hypothetical protein
MRGTKRVLVGHEAAQPEFLDPVPHLIAVDPEQLPGMRLIAAGALECLHKELTLDVFEVDAVGRQPEQGR